MGYAENQGNDRLGGNRHNHTFSKEGEVYVSYAADAGIEVRLKLTGDQPYQFTVIDTWNMKLSSPDEVAPGEFHYTTQNKYEAVRLLAKP